MSDRGKSAPSGGGKVPSDRSAQQLEWERSSEVHGPKFISPRDEPRVRVVVFGAVPLAVGLTRAARMLGWVPYVVDPRERFAVTNGFPDAERVLAAWPREAFEQLGGPDADTAVAALTHAPELDDEALILALRSPAFYVGAMGSRNTQRKRRERLAAAGCSEAEVNRLSGPAGLDLGGSTAQAAALAIAAEAVALRHGRSGARLTTSEQAIHAGGRP
ncbi:MAG: XdhC family protein [Solirubrobacteraceae bacterium]